MIKKTEKKSVLGEELESMNYKGKSGYKVFLVGEATKKICYYFLDEKSVLKEYTIQFDNNFEREIFLPAEK